MKNKIIDNKTFKNILKATLIPDIFYFNMDMLQRTYKDISGITLLLSSIRGSSYGSKIGGSLLGVVTIEAGNDNIISNEEIYSPKELLIQIFNNKKYSEHFKVLKVRLSEVYKKNRIQLTNIDILNSLHNESTIDGLQYDNILRVLNEDTPRDVLTRSERQINYFEDIYVFLEKEYTNGVLKDFLFNRNSHFYTTKPDIDADDFYLICLDSFSFDRIRDLTEGSPYYDLIYPLAAIRIKEKDIITTTR